MPVYHIVLIRLKEGLDPEAVKAWQTEGKAMVGKVPGLQSFEVNSPFPWSAHKSEGRFNMAVVAVLEKPEHVETYEVHPIHDALAERYKAALFDDSVAYDLVF